MWTYNNDEEAEEMGENRFRVKEMAISRTEMWLTVSFYDTRDGKVSEALKECLSPFERERIGPKDLLRFATRLVELEDQERESHD